MPLIAVVLYCRQESECAVVGASCNTIPVTAEGRCQGWAPVPGPNPVPLCRDGVRCVPPEHRGCAPLQQCTYCSQRTVCNLEPRPAAVFRYYEAVITGVRPLGGFADGGTTITLLGYGFDGFGSLRSTNATSQSATQLAAFGGQVQPILALSATTAVVRTPAFRTNSTMRIANGTSSAVVLSISLNGLDFEGDGDTERPPVTFRYYEHRTLRLEPFGGPSIGGTAVSVVGVGFDGYDGRASSARCSFGPLVVRVEVLEATRVACITPQAIRRLTDQEAAANMAYEEPPPPPPPPPTAGAVNGTMPRGSGRRLQTMGAVVGAPSDSNASAGGGGGGVEEGGGAGTMALIGQPDYDASYMWSNGRTTSEQSRYAAPVRVAINEMDFRGSVDFVFYHQVTAGLAAQVSQEYLMSVAAGTYADFAAGPPRGGFPITLVGSGFDGYDNNPSTIRVRFSTEGSAVPSVDSAGGHATPDTTLNATAAGAGASSADYIEVSAVSVKPTEVVVIAPAVSLQEGEINNKRGFPCWNPPCRRTVVTIAINGVDFVSRPDPLVFYFFNDPFRWLGLMIKELLLGLVALIALCLINGIVTWRYRFQVYDAYLSLKYRIKNKIFERKYPVFDHFKDEL